MKLEEFFEIGIRIIVIILQNIIQNTILQKKIYYFAYYS